MLLGPLIVEEIVIVLLLYDVDTYILLIYIYIISRGMNTYKSVIAFLFFVLVAFSLTVSSLAPQKRLLPSNFPSKTVIVQYKKKDVISMSISVGTKYQSSVTAKPSIPQNQPTINPMPSETNNDP